MTGLDTNVLVRYLTQDDDAQFMAALALLNRKGANFFVTEMVFVELDWVLSTVYDWSCEEVADTFARLLTIQNLIVPSEIKILAALKAVRRGADLSDELIVAGNKDAGCKDFATFDKGIIKRHRDFAFAP